jgi:hypothetical protein
MDSNYHVCYRDIIRMIIDYSDRARINGIIIAGNCKTTNSFALITIPIPNGLSKPKSSLPAEASSSVSDDDNDDNANNEADNADAPEPIVSRWRRRSESIDHAHSMRNGASSSSSSARRTKHGIGSVIASKWKWSHGCAIMTLDYYVYLYSDRERYMARFDIDNGDMIESHADTLEHATIATGHGGTYLQLCKDAQHMAHMAMVDYLLHVRICTHHIFSYIYLL